MNFLRKLRQKFPFLVFPHFLIRRILFIAFFMSMWFMFFNINFETIKSLFNLKFYLFRTSWMWNLEENEANQYEYDQWQFIGAREHKFQIYSAYFDDRIEIVENYQAPPNQTAYASIRLITILPLKVNKNAVNCNIVYRNGTTTKSRAMRVITIKEYFHTTYIATFVICALTKFEYEEQIEFPVAVGITYDEHESMRNVTSLVRIRYSNTKTSTIGKLPTLDVENKDQLSICVGPAQENFKNVLRVVEFVEFYKLLGATKFYFYNSSITPDEDKLFRYYEESGIVEILQWHIEGYAFEKELRYDGMFAMMNDCVYRSTIVDNFKFTAMVDFDEIIIPLAANTTSLLELLKERDRDTIHSFCFPNVLLFYTFPKNYDSVPANTSNKFLYSQVIVTRTATPNGHHDRSKVIAKGKNILELGNHMVYKALENKTEYLVQSYEGLSYHYRDMCLDNYCNVAKTIDESARRYGGELWRNVDQVCGQVFEDGVCVFNNADKNLKLI